MKYKVRRFGVLPVLLGFVLACMTASAGQGDGTMTTASQASVDMVYAAKQDLANRLKIAPGDIELVVSEEVTWRDGSLGCPKPGMAYTQALVDGMRIVLSVNGRKYHYHSGRSRTPVYCANPQLSSPPVGSKDM